MTRMQSKQRERWLLEQFLRKERISTSIREDEAPDFRVDIDVKRLELSSRSSTIHHSFRIITPSARGRGRSRDLACARAICSVGRRRRHCAGPAADLDEEGGEFHSGMDAVLESRRHSAR